MSRVYLGCAHLVDGPISCSKMSATDNLNKSGINLEVKKQLKKPDESINLILTDQNILRVVGNVIYKV